MNMDIYMCIYVFIYIKNSRCARHFGFGLGTGPLACQLLLARNILCICQGPTEIPQSPFAWKISSLCVASRIWVRHRSVVTVPPPEGGLKFRWDSEKSGCFIPVPITPVTGSVFWGPKLVSKAFFSNEFSKTKIRIALYWYPTDITLCFRGVDSFILHHTELELSIDTFSRSLSPKRNLRENSRALRFWIEAGVNFFRTTKLSRRDYLDYFER